MWLEAIRLFGKEALSFYQLLGRAGIFLWQVLVRRPQPVRSFPLLIEQIFHVGVLTVLLISISSLFVGMVLGLQGYNTLAKFDAEQDLGQLLALSVVRELGPVITGLLFAGRAGSALTAEIGLMKTTEQLKAMEVMAVDPLWRVISPRFWAGFWAMPILTIIFNVIAIWGGFLVGVEWLGLDSGSFWSNMQSAVDFKLDIMGGIIKSFVFGLITVWIATFQGYDCTPTAAGMGRATTNTVVYSSFAILGLDFVLTAMMIGGW